MSENKIFIAHSYGSNYYLYGVVCTISGTTIIAGTDTQLSNTSYAGYEMSSVLINNNKIFIAHNGDSSSTGYLYGVVCTISGTTIIAGTDTQLSTASYTGKYISAVALSNNKVFVTYSYASSYRLYSMVCTIDGTTITAGSQTQLNSGSETGSSMSAVALSEIKVFVAHSRGR